MAGAAAIPASTDRRDHPWPEPNVEAALRFMGLFAGPPSPHQT
jgi:hypothetical protein